MPFIEEIRPKIGPSDPSPARCRPRPTNVVIQCPFVLMVAVQQPVLLSCHALLIGDVGDCSSSYHAADGNR